MTTNFKFCNANFHKLQKSIRRNASFPVLHFLLVIACFSCIQQSSFDPKGLDVEWRLIQNNYQGTSGFLASLTLTNNTSAELPAGGWKIFFSLRYHGYTLASKNPALEIRHVSGDLFTLTPTKSFVALKRGQSILMEFTGNRRIANYQDVPSGLFWVSDEYPGIAVDLHNPIVQAVPADTTYEQLPWANAQLLFQQNQAADIPSEQLIKILPTPAMYRETKNPFALNTKTTLTSDKDFLEEARYLADELRKVLGSPPAMLDQGKGGITLKKVSMPAESYRLTSGPDGIEIHASDPSGIFYGIQSLKQLLPVDSWKSPSPSITVPGVEIEDRPRFGFRAFMLDVGRNFQSKEKIIRLLEVMSVYKMNVFHFHFSDDEGWRLEIPGLSELTEVGARRGFPFEDNSRLHPSYGSGSGVLDNAGSGFYSRADFIEILKYATVRHIKVIPEIESPGHARAAIKAMDARYEKYMKENNKEEAERYLLRDLNDQSIYLSNQGFRDNVMNVSMPSSYRFVEKVIDEIMKMYADAGAPLTMIHMAGDEVPFGAWEKSPAAKALMEKEPAVKSPRELWGFYFEKIKKILKDRQLALYGWQELVVGTQTENDGAHVIRTDYLKDNVLIDAWWNQYGNEAVPYQLANLGYRTILVPFDYFYFDLSYYDSFDEPGDGWVGFLDAKKTLSFIPFDYYRNAYTDMQGKARPENFFKDKERLFAKSRQKIEGIQGALWGENLVSGELMEYHVLPKLLPLAEKAWAAEPAFEKEPDATKSDKLFAEYWSQFANRIGSRELSRLDFYNGGYGYRIPTPGAEIRDGKVFMNVQFPGLAIRYTTDGSEPNEQSAVYSGPIDLKQPVRLRAFDTRGRAGKTVEIKN